jgi:hypothetical protein
MDGAQKSMAKAKKLQLLIRPYCVATEEGEITNADPSLRCASFRMTASGDAILSGRINNPKQFRVPCLQVLSQGWED